MIVLLVIVAGASIVCSAILACLAICYISKATFPCGEEGSLSSEVTIIIPSLDGGKQLTVCLKALSDHMPQCVRKVIVILQESSVSSSNVFCNHWEGSVELKICHISGTPSKSAAISCGLCQVVSDWVLLLDSDVCISSNIERFFDSSMDFDAAYGMIVLAEQETDTLLDRVVMADKMVSHGVWRLGRFAAGLWPNIPGQCYTIRTDLLRELYRMRMGHLDDFAMTLQLVARQCRIRFVPYVVGFEEGRSTWVGLFSQRVRWAIGLIQTFRDVDFSSERWFSSFCCWLLHVWLYSGWPLFSGMVFIALTFSGRCLFGLGFLLAFLGTWSLLAMVANRIFRHVCTDFRGIGFVSTALPASFVIMATQLVGFLLAPGFALFEHIKPLQGIRLLHKR